MVYFSNIIFGRARGSRGQKVVGDPKFFRSNMGIVEKVLMRGLRKYVQNIIFGRARGSRAQKVVGDLNFLGAIWVSLERY